MKQVKIFSTTNCMQCKMVKRWLTEHNVEFEEVNIQLEENKSERMRLRKEGFMSAPITYFGETIVQGFNPSELNKCLRKG